VIPQRYLLITGTFLLSLQLYVTRTCISTAKDAVTADLSLSNEQWSWILASFAFGYALFAAPGGAMADRLGGRRVLTTVVIAWSVFTALSAAAWNFVSLLVIRFLFGVSEAGAFPGMARVVYSWIPVKERGLVKGINFSGSRIGAALAMPGVAWLITELGWHKAFLILMAVGLAWALFWWFWFRDEPEKKVSISKKELDFILANRQDAGNASSPAEPLRVGTIFASGNLWLMMLQYFASNFTFFFSLTWLYPYVKAKYNLGAMDAGWYAMVPLLGGAVGNIFAGGLVDWIYRHGRASLSRKLPAIIGFALAAVGMVMSLEQATAAGAIFWLTLAIFGADMTLSPSWSFCIDIGGKHAGAVSGTMNMAGNLGSAIAALAFAYMPESNRGNVAFFYTAAALSVGGIVCWLISDPARKIQPQPLN
jgi:ACS family glucarate transporter-like MFS transporter